MGEQFLYYRLKMIMSPASLAKEKVEPVLLRSQNQTLCKNYWVLMYKLELGNNPDYLTITRVRYDK